MLSAHRGPRALPYGILLGGMILPSLQIFIDYITTHLLQVPCPSDDRLQSAAFTEPHRGTKLWSPANCNVLYRSQPESSILTKTRLGKKYNTRGLVSEVWPCTKVQGSPDIFFSSARRLKILTPHCHGVEQQTTFGRTVRDSVARNSSSHRRIYIPVTYTILSATISPAAARDRDSCLTLRDLLLTPPIPRKHSLAEWQESHFLATHRRPIDWRLNDEPLIIANYLGGGLGRHRGGWRGVGEGLPGLLSAHGTVEEGGRGGVDRGMLADFCVSDLYPHIRSDSGPAVETTQQMREA